MEVEGEKTIMLKIGSHVGMSGKKMFLGSVEEAVSYGANTFMVYTGAPQNTRRKKMEELRVEEGHAAMKKAGIEEFIVHAPYIINLANTVKPETFEIAVQFLALELDRTEKLGSKLLVLHPGSHVGAGVDAGISKIIEGINEVLTRDTNVFIAIETMAGKGTEIGRNFEELARIIDGVKYNDKLRVCFDTCHVNDSGYDIVNHYDEVIDEFDKIVGKEKIAVFHVNDSKNVRGAQKDRHENFGFGSIGFDALRNVVMDERFCHIPKILETPYIKDPDNAKKSYPPYRFEIEMIKDGTFREDIREQILQYYR